MASTNSLAGYKVGEISQALLTKDRKAKTVKNENVQLNALFSSASLFQPQFVSVTSKLSKKTVEPVLKKQSHKDESKEVSKHTQDTAPFSYHARKRKVPTSDDEGNEVPVEKSRKRNKKSNEAEEDPDRLARTVFVGNLPVAFTRKKLKQLFAIYGEVESVRFRSAALAKPHLSRKVAMKKREFHEDRHNINGYVVFKEKDCAIKSLKSNGMELDGFHIRVDLTGQNNKHDHSRSIFVGNLPFDTEEEPLRQAFMECGDIEAVRIVRDSKTGAGKGFGFILFKKKEAVMFALKKNKTAFRGRPLRIFPSSENPQQGQSRDAKKGRPKTYSFSGITARRGMKNELKGRKKQRLGKGYKGSQGFSAKPIKNERIQKHRKPKINNPKHKSGESNISKKSTKPNVTKNKWRKPSW